jgi:hypothetical protein
MILWRSHTFGLGETGQQGPNPEDDFIVLQTAARHRQQCAIDKFVTDLGGFLEFEVRFNRHLGSGCGHAWIVANSGEFETRINLIQTQARLEARHVKLAIL